MTRLRRLALILLLALFVLIPNDRSASAQAAPQPSINALWRAQPQVMAQEIATLQPRVAGHANVYAIAVAGQGSQALFSREAKLALQVTAARFGGDYRGGVLLSNVGADLATHPLATRENVTAAARGIAGKIDPAHDLVVVYLASHGAPDAFIATSLSNQLPLVPISSASLAEALAQAGITRRVVIVSACFSASWIPSLASDDTIVIAPAARDPTSFGCDDTRLLTYFGEALLQGPLARGASLHESFDTARATVTKWETRDGFVPSMPQAFVGRNLQDLWNERAMARK